MIIFNCIIFYLLVLLRKNNIMNTDITSVLEKIRPNYIQTTCHKIDISNPKSDDIFINDIAKSLSNLCRYNGHVKKFYSVAEHCCIAATYFKSPRMKLVAMLHDAAEAYIGDVITPLKNILYEFQEIEKIFHSVIYERFGIYELTREEIDLLNEVDLGLLKHEKAAILHENVDWWGSELPDIPEPNPTFQFFDPIDACTLYSNSLLEIYKLYKPELDWKKLIKHDNIR